MLKHLYILLISTFIAGFLTGVYVYMVNRIQTESTPTDNNPKGFVIVADMYGGCEMFGQCPSYRLLQNGSYTYIIDSREGEGGIYEDNISRQRKAEILLLLKETDFEAIEDSEFTGTCPIAFDGPAYSFEIFFDGETYNIDTCIEAVEGEPLIDSLIDYFEIFRLTHT